VTAVGPILSALLFFGFNLFAYAEPVRVSVATGSASDEGQGWLFKDTDTGYCGVVTASHVVAPSGVVGTVTIRTASGAEGGAADVRVLSPDAPGGLDVALIKVNGTILANGCTSSTLGSSDLTLELAKSKLGMIEWLSPDKDQFSQEVELYANNTDDPRKLALRPRNTEDAIVKGYSGTPVTMLPEDMSEPGLDPLPIAMITQVHDETAEAVRFDAIYALVEPELGNQEPANQDRNNSPNATGYQLVSWDGVTADPACPAANVALTTAACGWKAIPLADNRSVNVVLAPNAGQISSVAATVLLDASELSARMTIEVSGDDSGDNWAWVATGPIASASPTVIRFQPVTAKRVRITVPTSPSRSSEIRDIILQ